MTRREELASRSRKLAMSEPLRFCKNCKHVLIEALGITYAKCGRLEAVKEVTAPDFLVSGDGPTHEVSYCSTMRLSASKCGPEGRLWEAKEPEPQTDFTFES